MDLVRNNIFHRAAQQKALVEELYTELWDPLDDSWWKDPAPNARPTRPRIDHFLAHVLAAETGNKISMRELYAEYRAFAIPKGKPRFANVEDELRLIEVYSPHYETLEGRNKADTTLYWLGRKLASWQVTTAYPIAMQIGRAKLEPGEHDAIARLIYSYIVRRAICGLTTKNLNNVFQSISAQFVAKGVSRDVFADYFSDKTGDSTKFPSDAEFKNGILNGNAYSISPSPRLVDILWELELASRTKLAEKAGKSSGLWVEHVLPQTWDEKWPFADGTMLKHDSEDARAVARNQCLHTLGNLTLLSGGLNISSGNKSFETKKKKFNKNTGLFLNKWFQNYSKWDELEIAERGKALTDLSLKIWAGLETHQ